MEEKRGEGKREDGIRCYARMLGPAGVETTTPEPRVSNRIPSLGRDEHDDTREERMEES